MFLFAVVAGFVAALFAAVVRVVLAPVIFLLRKLDERPATGRTHFLSS